MRILKLAQLQVEPLIWKLAFIQNALTEIFIIPKANEKGWFANLWDINQKISRKIPQVRDMQKYLTKLMPARIPEDHILHVSTPNKDMMAIKEYKYEINTLRIPTPRIRSIDEHYRINLDKDHNQSEASEVKKPKKRKSLDKARKPVSKSKKRKRKISSDHESEPELETQREPEQNLENDSEDTSSEEDINKNKAIILGSSTSEDEDFL